MLASIDMKFFFFIKSSKKQQKTICKIAVLLDNIVQIFLKGILIIMKKLLYFFLCLFTIFMLAGCDSVFGDDDEEDDSSSYTTLKLDEEKTDSVDSGFRVYNRYSFKTDSAGDYTISITNFESSSMDMDWALFGNKSSVEDYIDIEVDGEDHSDLCIAVGDNEGSSEIGSASLSESTEYFLLVEDFEQVGGSFTIKITSP